MDMAVISPSRRRAWRWTFLLAILGGVGVLGLAVVVPCMVPARTTARRAACINNLRQIDAAKQQWASETRQPPGSIIVVSEVDQYIPNGPRRCPGGGTYDYGKVGAAPRCTVKGHTL